MVRFIAELGSNHYGKLSRIKQAVDICKQYNMELKLQLFPNEAPYVPTNVWLDPKIFTQAFNYGKKQGVSVSASAFHVDLARYIADHKPDFIKFAYSKKDQVENYVEHVNEEITELIVSCDVMTDRFVPSRATKLYCIPEYPVRYEVNFDELFPRFDGFSDHTLGLRQTRKALMAGARIIEKHVKLDADDFNCPDDMFAVPIRELGEFKKTLDG